MLSRTSVILSLLFWCACAPSSQPPEASERTPSPPKQAVVAPPPASVDAARRAPEMRVVSHALTTSVQAHVVSALAEAEADKRRLVVYVGAPWCEPCRRFHDAVKAGELNDALEGVRFLEFDHDVHQEGLKSAGYLRRFVPLFAIPDPDGSASERLHQGAIKGPGAVDFIMPHLKALLR